jgi:MscS family membrane protein
MKPKVLFRIYCAAVLGVITWTIFSSAQNTNTNTAAVTVQTSEPVKSVTTLIDIKPTSLSFGLHKVEALQVKFGGIPLWQYVAAVIYVLIAMVISKLLDLLIAGYLKKWAQKTATTVDDLLIELLRGPIKIFIFVIFLHVGLQLFDFPVWLRSLLGKGFSIALALSITYMLMKLVDLFITYFRTRTAARNEKHFNDLLFPILSKVVKATILILAVLLTLDNIGLNIRTLLAGISVSGLAVGLAAQDTVGNLFGAVSVFIDKPFQVGDRIQLSGVDGTVESISMRSTRIRNLDGHLITVPNKTMGNTIITNITRRPNIKTVMNIGITYDTTAGKVQRAVDILREVFRNHPMTHDVQIAFNQFGDSALNIQVVHWWKSLDHPAYLAGIQEMNLAIKERFDNEGIGFAFPSRTVYLKQEGEWKLENAAA